MSQQHEEHAEWTNETYLWRGKCTPHTPQGAAAQATKAAEDEAAKVEESVDLLLKRAERALLVLGTIEAAEEEVGLHLA